MALNQVGQANFGTNSLGNTAGDCYQDSDCTFYYRDSSGKVNPEIVGQCVRSSSTLSECHCTPPFFGRNCQLKHCPNATHNRLECGGPERGVCDSTTGLCTCHATPTSQVERAAGRMAGSSHSVQVESFYTDLWTMQQHVTQVFGEACELRRCPNKCSNQGECVAERDGQEYTCRCFPGFFSEDCSHRRCPLSYRDYVCDNHGKCNTATGSCICNAGYYGRDCHYETRVGWYSHSGTGIGSTYVSSYVRSEAVSNPNDVHSFYRQPQIEIDINPATTMHYERRSCHTDKFASTHLNSYAAKVTDNMQHATWADLPPHTNDDCGATHTKYYGAYNDTHYTASASAYDVCSKIQLVESTAAGDLQGQGSHGSINYATTTEGLKLC